MQDYICQAGSTLHMMAVFQMYQAKLLRDMDENSKDPAVFKELRSATDLNLLPRPQPRPLKPQPR